MLYLENTLHFSLQSFLHLRTLEILKLFLANLYNNISDVCTSLCLRHLNISVSWLSGKVIIWKLREEKVTDHLGNLRLFAWETAPAPSWDGQWQTKPHPSNLHFHCWYQPHWGTQRAPVSANCHHIQEMSDRDFGKTQHACSSPAAFLASSNVSPKKENKGTHPTIKIQVYLPTRVQYFSFYNRFLIFSQSLIDRWFDWKMRHLGSFYTVLSSVKLEEINQRQISLGNRDTE